MILVDEPFEWTPGMWWAHMVSDQSLDELHQFAAQLGLKRSWFQPRHRASHYDLRGFNMLHQAIKAGAKVVGTRELLRRSANQ